jgi:hypothetical protein
MVSSNDDTGICGVGGVAFIMVVPEDEAVVAVVLLLLLLDVVVMDKYQWSGVLPWI